MGDSLVPSGLSIVCEVLCSRSMCPRTQCMGPTSPLPSSASSIPMRIPGLSGH